MTKLFQKRRSAFINQCLKYLRYVLNDHFVLVLVFFMGFLMFQYSSLLKNFPSNHFPIIVISPECTLLWQLEHIIIVPQSVYLLPGMIR